MLQTLFVIPYEVAGVKLFGFGALLAAWVALCTALIAWRVRREGFSADVRGMIPIALIVAAVLVALPSIFPTGLPVRGYGVMMLLGVVSGVALAWYRARRVGLNPEIIFSLAFWMFISGIAGARVFYVIEYWNEFRTQHTTFPALIGAVLNISQGGLVVYGSFIAVMGAIVLFVRRYRVPGLALCDLVIPSMLLGLAFGRVGCFFNGCCFGGQCELPWSVQFPWASPPFERQASLGHVDLHGIWLGADEKAAPVIARVSDGSPADQAGLRSGDLIRAVAGSVRDYNANGRLEWKTVRDEVNSVAAARRALFGISGEGATITIETLRHDATTNSATSNNVPKSGSINSATWTLAPPPRSLPVHPAQLYSAIDALLICGFLLAYWPYRRRDGELLALALMIYSVTRFFEEIVRIDEFSVFGTGLSISQNISLAVFAAGVVLICVIHTRPPRLAFVQRPL